MKVYSIRNGKIFELEIKVERTNKHRKEQECNCDRPFEKWERLLSNREWVNSLSNDEFSAWLADVVSKQNKNRLEWYWWLNEKHGRETDG